MSDPDERHTPEQAAVLAAHHITADQLPGVFMLWCTCSRFDHTERYSLTSDTADGQPVVQALGKLADAGRDHIVDELRKAGNLIDVAGDEPRSRPGVTGPGERR